MADVEGIVVELETSNESWAGLGDHLYVGVCGTEGGREFNLNVANFDDYEPGSKINYEIGKKFAFDAPGPEKTPITAPNALTGGSKVEQPAVTHVYLRKHGRDTSSADDAWKLKSARVWLFNSVDPSRVFTAKGPLTLSIEDGLQVWLATGFD
ncbi:MAG: hypothetical protein ACREJU_18920 [Nitrospiraceae bacterium]